MQVLVNSGKHVTSSMDFKDDIRSRIRDKLQRYEDHLTRIEIHLSDENALKSGPQDKRCKVEARDEGTRSTDGLPRCQRTAAGDRRRHEQADQRAGSQPGQRCQTLDTLMRQF